MAYSHIGYGQGQGQRVNFDLEQRTNFHEQMEEIVESGTYADLQNLREESNRYFARWVDSEEDFNLFKENFKERTTGEGCPMRGQRRGMGRNFQ